MRIVGFGIVRTPVAAFQPRQGPQPPNLDFLRIAWEDDIFREGIHLASPVLARSVTHTLAGHPTTEKALRRQALSIAGYLLRSHGRTTPYGLWAGVTPFTVSTEVHAHWHNNRSHSQPDYAWLDSLVKQLHQRLDVVSHLTVAPHPSLTWRGHRLERDIAEIREGKSSLRHISVEATDFAKWLIEHSKNGASVTSIVSTRLRKEDSRVPGLLKAIADLLACGVLVSDLDTAIQTSDPLTALQKFFHTAEIPSVYHQLSDVKTALGTYDSSPIGQRQERLDAAHQALLSLTKSKAKLSTQLEMSAEVRLPPAVTDDIEEAVDLLLKLFPPERSTVLDAWHATFLEQYGTHNPIPILEALDKYIGIGGIGAQTARATHMPAPQEAILMELGANAYKNQTREIVLSEAIIRQLRDSAGSSSANTSTERGPQSFDVSVELLARSCSALEKGDYSLANLRLSRTVAGAALSRFEYQIKPIENALIHEIRRCPPATSNGEYAEVHFSAIPPERNNILRSPNWVKHHINVDIAVQQPGMTGLSDLALVSDGKELTLWSSRQGIQLVPVSHSLVAWNSAPPVAQFLLQLGERDAPIARHWSWGRAASKLPKLPRVRKGRTILSPAQWRLPVELIKSAQEDTKAWSQFTQWANEADVSPVVVIGSSEAELVIDTHNPLHVHVLRHEVKQGKVDTLREALADGYTTNTWLGGQPRRTELVLPAFCRQEKERYQATSSFFPRISAHTTHLPGGKWVYVRLKVPSIWHNRILISFDRLLKEKEPYVERWFFVRYHDENNVDELRLRIKAIAAETSSLLAIIAAWVAELIRQRLTTGFTWDTYMPEETRYGAGKMMEHAEHVFQADSALAMRELSSELEYEPLVVAAASAYELLHSFNPSEEALDWIRHDRRPPSIENARALREQLQGFSGKASRSSSDWQSWRKQVNVELNKLREAATSYGHLVQDPHWKERISQSLFHMHCNRFLGMDRELESAAIWLTRRIFDQTKHFMS